MARHAPRKEIPVPTLNTSLISSVSYKKNALTVDFQDGSVVRYHGVDQATYDTLLASTTPNTYFIENMVWNPAVRAEHVREASAEICDASVDEIRRLVCAYDDAVTVFPAYALAWHLIMQAPERPSDCLTYHGTYFKAMTARDCAEQYLRERLRTYETGCPAHTAWTPPLEDFDAVLARARLI